MTVTTNRRNLQHSHYPLQLRELGIDAPDAYWQRGEIELSSLLDNHPFVTLTGARAATSYGEHVAMDLASELAYRRVGIVTGSAYGIDIAVIRAVLAAQGHVIVVLSSGLDNVYPKANEVALKRVVEEGGLVVSTEEMNAIPNRTRFLRRNQIMAALGKGTVIVEAGIRGGSMDVADNARALNRAVMAVPGPVTSALSAGTHKLIRDGARMVTTAAEITQEIPMPVAAR